MKKNNLFRTGLKACIAFSFLALSVQNSSAQICIGSGSDQETNEGNLTEQYYKLWNQESQGTSCMDVGEGFLFSTNWSGINNHLARRGYRYDESETHSQLGHYTVAYNCDYNPVCNSGNSYLSIYGWTYNSNNDHLVEYYIIEDWCNWIPSMDGNAQPMGNITVNGAEYEVIKVNKYNAPSIKGDRDFVQYFSVRQNTRSIGTIDISKHFQEWEATNQMPMGNMYEITMVVEGYQNSGSASFSKLDFGYSRGPGQENNATSVSFNESSYSVAQGISGGALGFHWSPSGSTLSNLYIVSSDPSVASIGVYNGYFFAHGESTGTATLTIMSGTTSNSTATVNVTGGGGGGGNAKSIVINALGKQGTEKIALLVDGTPMNIYTLTEDFQTYTATVAGDGDITVEFMNDDGLADGRDVRLDYIEIDGVRRETEDMAENSAAYDNGVCGGGSYTEWLHCSGEVNYGPIESNHTITIRARGNNGGEHIDLLINGQAVNGGWWMGTSYQEYTATVSGDGDINVEFDNDGDQKDVVIDWVRIDNQNVRQAENMEYNTGAWANNQCGGGSYTQWLHCNGVIGFGNISDNFKSARSNRSGINENNTSSVINIYPNPGTGDLSIELAGSDLNASITIFDLAGKVIYTRDSINEKLTQITNLESGMYIVNIISNDSNYNKKIVVK